MATLTPNAQLGFLELSKRTNDSGMIEIAEVLTAKMPILMDIPWRPTNMLASEKFTRRASLPTGSFRKAYEGVTKEASTTQVVVEPTALIEARSEIDEAILDVSPNPTQVRRDEDMAFVEGMSQTFAKKLFSGTLASSPEEFNGLGARLNDLTQRTVIGNGGTGGDTTSIYAVDWGARKTHCIYPSNAANRGALGLSAVNIGREVLLDGSDLPYYGMVTQFKWWVGLVVRDEFSIGRLANIEVSGTDNLFNEDKLIELLNEGNFNRATTRLYYNQKIATQAQIRMKDKGNNEFWSQATGLSGVPMTMFDGVICQRMEDTIITNTETVVS
jgi:hypothetical protein